MQWALFRTTASDAVYDIVISNASVLRNDFCASTP